MSPHQTLQLITKNSLTEFASQKSVST